MPLTASVSRTVRATPTEAFAKFVDFPSWKQFMPRAFRPLSGPDRALRTGDRLRALLDTGKLRIPVPVKVFRVEAPREVVWGGGNALLRAEHRFVFEDAGDGTTRIHSDEDWTGVLTRIPPIARRLKRQAEIVGAAQLDGFMRFMERGA